NRVLLLIDATEVRLLSLRGLLPIRHNDPSGKDTVYADFWSQTDSQSMCEDIDSALRGGVRFRMRLGLKRARGRNVYDSATLLPEMRNGMLRAEKIASQIHCYLSVPLLQAELFHRRVVRVGNACIIDQPVDTTIPVDRLCYHVLHRELVGRIRLH